ncbi:MAG: SDR family oxidoreductase [Pirellulales bacterium]
MTSSESKVAIVTGSTQGLGEAIARELIAEKLVGGLVICGRREVEGRKLADEFAGLGCRTEFVQADLGNVDDCRRVIASAGRAFGRVDYLVNSAATSERGSILDTSPELFDRIFALNVRAPFFLMQEALRLMIEQQIAGSIVNIITMSSHGGQPYLTPFGRLLKPAEVARAVSFLLSERSGMMTGSIIDFDQNVVGTSD